MYTESQKYKLGQCDALMGRPCATNFNTYADKANAENYMRGYYSGQDDIQAMVSSGIPHVVKYPRAANDR